MDSSTFGECEPGGRGSALAVVDGTVAPQISEPERDRSGLAVARSADPGRSRGPACDGTDFSHLRISTDRESHLTLKGNETAPTLS